MTSLYLRVHAPFAAFRGFQAGVYRTTAPTIPPSAALGLVLNLAGIEMRRAGAGVTTLIREDVPRLRIAIGTPADEDDHGRPKGPQIATLYQQLHSYPVGASGRELKERTHGAKYWIAPVRREVLVDFEAIVGVQTEPALLERVRRGLAGELDEERYGLPFAGDNNFLFDQIELLERPRRAHWYTRLGAGSGAVRGSCRLTVGIDRQDNSRTTLVLVAPAGEPTEEPPEAAWVWTPGEAP